jgi:hypothetical protein
MPDPDTPDTQAIPLPGGPTVRLTPRRLGDVPPGALVTRRLPHQLKDELTGEAYDLVMGVSIRTTRATDPVLAEGWVWQVEILLGEG